MAIKNYIWIEKASRGEKLNLKEMPSDFYTWKEDAQPFLIEIGKRARAIAQAEGASFPQKMMMKEIEACYGKALHADCAYTIYVNCHHALGWFSKMVRNEL